MLTRIKWTCRVKKTCSHWVNYSRGWVCVFGGRWDLAYCTCINCEDLLQHKCWHRNLSHNCLLAQEDRICELLIVICSQFSAAWIKRASPVAVFLLFHFSTFFGGMCFPSALKAALISMFWEAAERWGESGWLMAIQVITIQRVLSYSRKAKLLVQTAHQPFSAQFGWPSCSRWTERSITGNTSCSQPGSFCDVLQISCKKLKFSSFHWRAA